MLLSDSPCHTDTVFIGASSLSLAPSLCACAIDYIWLIRGCFSCHLFQCHSYRKDGVPIYEEAVRAMKRQETTTIYVDFEHLSDFNAELAQVRVSFVAPLVTHHIHPFTWPCIHLCTLLP